MNTQLMTSPVFAVTYTANGKKLVCFYNDYVPHSVRVERYIGLVHPVDRVIEVSPIHWGKSFEELLKLWERDELDSGASEVAETKADDEAEREAKRLPILDGIIRTSNQEGEVQNARSLWKRYTGKEWSSE